MKLMKIIQTVLCSLFLLSCSQNNNVPRSADGRALSLATLKGKWLIINYWADWCEACVQEVPELNQFYQDEQGKDVVLYGVNYDHLAGNDLQKAIKKTNIAFPVLGGDPSAYWSISGIEFLPTTFIINPAGQVVQKLVGPNTEKSLQEAVLAARANAS